MKKKNWIIIGGTVLLVAVIILVIFLFSGNKEIYRNIKVQELTGETEVTRDRKELDAYKGMQLQGNDELEVQADSDLMLKLDNEKYVYARELTHFWLEAAGNKRVEQMIIHLEEGQVLIDIQEKLSEEESFEVETGNVLMAVRGTTFLVNSYVNEDGETVTELSVFDGEVAVEDNDGEELAEVSAGDMVIVTGEDNPVVEEQEVNQDSLPEDIIARLEQLGEEIKDSEDKSGEKDSAPTMAPGMDSYEGVTKNGLKYKVSAGYVTINGLSDEVDRESITEIEIPTDIDGYLVNVINKEAFAYCTALEKVVLPGSISTIHDEAFKHCYKLVDITLPKSLYYLGTKAFWECHSLAEIEIPSGVTKINSWTFSSCKNLTTVELPDGMKDIGVEAFSDCASLNRIKLPDTIKSIGTNAFAGCSSLEKINLPSGLQLICPGTFSECTALTEIQIPEGVTSIGEKAFFECENLKKVSFPDTLSRIEIQAFASCTSLTQLEFNEGLKMIREHAFSNCKEVSQVQLPASLSRMENGVFAECGALTTISAPAGSYGETWALENEYLVINP